MYKILCLILIFGISLSWAGLPDEEQQEDPNWVPKSDSDGNIVWHNPSAEDELESAPSHKLFSQQNCSQDYDCISVSTVPGSSRCTGNLCVCRVELGFSGLALPWDKCICPIPKIISWSGGAPMCTFNFAHHSSYVDVMASSSLSGSASRSSMM